MTREEWKRNRGFDEISREMNGDFSQYRYNRPALFGGFMAMEQKAELPGRGGYDKPAAQ